MDRYKPEKPRTEIICGFTKMSRENLMSYNTMQLSNTLRFHRIKFDKNANKLELIRIATGVVLVQNVHGRRRKDCSFC